MNKQGRDRRLKWLILLIPTLTIGLWEYVRHAFLLPYMSMDLGNFLAPFIVLAVTLTLVLGLFRRLEQSQAALQQEKASNAALEERERLAGELHDGIAQSLFLLAVKLDQLDEMTPAGPVREQGAELRNTVRLIHDDVRQAIARLRQPPSPAEAAWVAPLRELLGETAQAAGAQAEFVWNIPDDKLTAKEKVELHACMREALINVRKHARAGKVYVYGTVSGGAGNSIGDGVSDGGVGKEGEGSGVVTVGGVGGEGGGDSSVTVGDIGGSGRVAVGETGVLRCAVEDNGVGFVAGDPWQMPGRFGLKMVRERSRSIGWTFSAERRGDRTVMEWLRREAGE